MATGKNSGGWRGNRPAPQNANDATPAKPGWKQSAARPVAATTGFSLHRKISLAITALATLLIAVFLAWLFLPSNKLLTFVINPVSTLHSAPTTITHAANPPELTTRNNELNPVEILSGKPTDELAKIRKALESNQDSRKPTAAVIIYLQVIPVVNRNPIPSTNTPNNPAESPSPANNFFLLPRRILLSELHNLHNNGTAPADAVLPSQLQNNIQELLSSFSSAHVLLLIDQPPHLLPTLHGIVQLPVAETIANWPKLPGLERLAVIAASPDQQSSWPDPDTLSGQTAFATSCQTALTSNWDSLNKDKNQPLTADKFAEFVTADTARRLTRSLGSSAPKVLVAGNTNFPILSEPLPKSPAPATANPTYEVALVQLRQRLEQTTPSLPPTASLWLPTRIQKLQHTLLNAQHALLARNTPLTLEFLNDYDSQLQKLPADINTPPIPATPASETSDNTPEKILQNALASRATSVPSITELTEIQNVILKNRQLAERAASMAFASTDLLQPLLLPREEIQLLTEDRLLANAQAPNPAELNQQQLFLEAAANFADTRQKAHSLLAELFTQLPPLADYSRLTLQTTPDNLAELLRRNLRFADSEYDQILSLLNDARSQFSQTSTNVVHSRAAAILITARLIRIQLLDTLPNPTPETTLESTTAATNLLKTRTTALQTLLDYASTDKAEINQYLDINVNNVIRFSLEKLNQLQPDKLQKVARECRQLLFAPLSHKQRSDVLDSLTRLESQLPNSNTPAPATTLSQASPQDAPAESLPALQPARHTDLLWLLQLTQLLPSRSDMFQQSLAEFPDQPAQLTAETLHKIGSTLQAEWAANSQLNTLSKLDNTQQLRIADIQVRLLPPAIAQLTLPPENQPEISTRLRNALLADFRNLHIQRLRLSRWVLPTDQPPLADNGWYAREIQRWMNASGTPATPPDSAAPNPLPAIDTTLEPALEIEVTPPEVRFANNPNPILEVPIRIINPANLSGVAALQITPPTQPDDNAKTVLLPTPAAVTLNAPGNRDRLPLSLALQGGTPRPAPCSASDFQTAWFFRGRLKSSGNITLNPCEALEWTVTRSTHPTNSSLGVTSLSLNPVAFVLDWSSSMTGIDNDNEPRYIEAAAALQALINQQIQAGFVNARQVSLRVFGHRVGYNADNPNTDIPNPRYDSAFNGFQFPQGEANQKDIQGLIPMTFINPNMSNRFRDVIDRLKTAEPWGWSPLYQSIDEAISKDLGSQTGLVVAVTDGIPKDGPSDPERNKLPALLRNLNSLNGRVQVLILCMVPAETEGIQKQLEESLLIPDLNDNSRQLLRQSFLIRTAANTSDITAEIDLATKPAPLKIQNGDSQIVSVEGKIDPQNSRALVVYQSDQLDPSQLCRISLGAQRSDTAPLTAEFTPLLGGQVLLEADWKNNALKFKHEVSTDLSVPVQQAPENPGSPIRLVAVQTPDRKNRGQSADVQLQLLLDHEDYTKPVPLPPEVEFCYSTPTTFPATARIEESFQSFAGCPAWKINITGWNPDGRLKVHAFWKMNRSTPDEIISLNDALQLSSPNLARQLAPANIPKLRIWSFITDNQTLQVRIDPAPPYQPLTPGSHQRDPNSLHSVHIALVEKDAANQLQPLPCAVTIRRLENGSTVCEFRTPSNPPWTAPNKDRLHITLTSLKSRLQYALTTTTELQLD